MKAMSHPSGSVTWAVSALMLGVLGISVAAKAADPDPKAPSYTATAAENRFIGAKKCKSCHKTEDTGNQWGAWENAKHSKAFETLSSEAAKKIATEKGIADPAVADECVRCHVTAFGAEKAMIKRGFKSEMGVQCETCHGAGEQHMKARFDDAAAEVVDAKPAPGEIVATPTKAECKKCHNEESPTYKEFCFHDSNLKISHLRPERAAAVEALGISDCTACHTSGAELISPNPALCITCHDPVPERK